VPRHVHAPRVLSAAPERFSALRPPLDSGERSKVANPGCKNAPRERGRLFVRETGMTNGPVGIVCPGCDAARAAAKRCIADPGPPQTAAVPGLQRTVTLRFTLRRARDTRQNQPAAAGNDRRLSFIVSGLLFTMNAATPTCLSPQRPSRIQVAARLPTRSSSPINPANTGSTPMPRTTLASRVRSPSQSSPW
jgi:hypothetical protein